MKECNRQIEAFASQVAAQIAAGEVVERPASIVEELVENSIDSGASHISVAIEEGGIRSVTVTDDGAGIPPDQVEVDFKRHATSKLAKVEDLQKISTLGFRGEALPNIAAASRVTCVTKTVDQDAAVRYVVEFGVPQRPVQCAAAVGTSVKAENLLQGDYAMVATAAFHSAVRAIDRLTAPKMQAITNQLADTTEPHHCPHNRPTVITVSKRRLERAFRRCCRLRTQAATDTSKCHAFPRLEAPSGLQPRQWRPPRPPEPPRASPPTQHRFLPNHRRPPAIPEGPNLRQRHTPTGTTK